MIFVVFSACLLFVASRIHAFHRLNICNQHIEKPFVSTTRRSWMIWLGLPPLAVSVNVKMKNKLSSYRSHSLSSNPSSLRRTIIKIKNKLSFSPIT
jgi:hypothetical protein